MKLKKESRKLEQHNGEREKNRLWKYQGGKRERQNEGKEMKKNKKRRKK